MIFIPYAIESISLTKPIKGSEIKTVLQGASSFSSYLSLRSGEVMWDGLLRDLWWWTSPAKEDVATLCGIDSEDVAITPNHQYSYLLVVSLTGYHLGDHEPFDHLEASQLAIEYVSDLSESLTQTFHRYQTIEDDVKKTGWWQRLL